MGWWVGPSSPSPLESSVTIYPTRSSISDASRLGARAASPCIFGMSAGRQDQTISPCTLYLQNPIILLGAFTNLAGFARSQTFALPFSNNLRGFTFYAQAFVADPQGPVGGIAFSAGLELMIGD